MKAFNALICLLFMGILPNVDAASLTLGSKLPAVYIADKGEVTVQNDETGFRAWNSAMLEGKTRLVLHMAGRLSAKEMNAALIDAVKQAQFPRAQFATTTIINNDDAIPGSGYFVVRSIESSKREFPREQFIIDSSSVVKQAWHLASDSSAVIILDKQGTIRFAKDGTLSAAEIDQAINLLHHLLSTRGS